MPSEGGEGEERVLWLEWEWEGEVRKEREREKENVDMIKISSHLSCSPSMAVSCEPEVSYRA